ncbi:hypothetical protein [Aliiroseovarius lamellibrachiae]|uniref:hypothetical protein n=1 Tax=Aliiroseovarius lamellibrachiae TaxID=1924933 RepID=UPI001BE03F54|nr:hypothetical protein [Aliiroseovarius lamellibrachiae]MBT2130561.1 hypothetical protein [Aliiroseovarius lamellibrachiae]
MSLSSKYFNVAAVFAATFVFAQSVFVGAGFTQPIFDDEAFPKPRQALSTDLDGDGTPDRVLVYALNRSFDILSYELGYGGGDFGEREAFIVPVNLSDFDSLALLPNGNVTLTWGCFACGRYHTHISLTLRLDQDRLQVIGYDQYYADRIYAAVFSCSVNLITGKAVVEADDIEQVLLTTPERATHLQDYRFESTPKACDALRKYDDAFMEEHFGDER